MSAPANTNSAKFEPMKLAFGARPVWPSLFWRQHISQQSSHQPLKLLFDDKLYIGDPSVQQSRPDGSNMRWAPYMGFWRWPPPALRRSWCVFSSIKVFVSLLAASPVNTALIGEKSPWKLLCMTHGGVLNHKELLWKRWQRHSSCQWEQLWWCSI